MLNQVNLDKPLLSSSVEVNANRANGDKTSSLLKKVEVLLDARKIQHGGIGVYLRNIIAGIKHFPEINLTALTFPESKEMALKLGADNVITIDTKLYSFKELFTLHKIIDFKKFDLFHVPHFTLPYKLPIPSVVTIHDTIHLSHPEKWYYPLLIKVFIKSALKRATQVITVSEASKRNLESLNRKIKSAIKVIPNAVDPIFFLNSANDEDDYGEVTRQNYCVAVLSNSKPHKGLDDLVAAFNNLKDQTFIDNISNDELKNKIASLNLILVGTGVEKLKGSLSLGKEIEVKGAVSAKELKELYQKAQCLIVPSLAEGFCLPVIESQSCGTPVIARPVPAVLELMTTNDVVAGDFTVPSLTSAIFEFFKKRIERSDLVDYGVPLSHMQKFDIKSVCSEVALLYKSFIK